MSTRTDAQRRAYWEWLQRRAALGSLVVEHECNDCGTKETFERKQFAAHGWRRCWSRKDGGVKRQIDVCADCVEVRRLASPCPIPKRVTSRA